MKKMTLGLATRMAVFAVAAGAALPSFADGERIAVFTKNQTNPLFQSIRQGVDSAAKQMNATVSHYVPTKPDSIPEQMSQVEDVIVRKPDAIVFIPVDYKAMTPATQKINAAGIPVVAVGERTEGGHFDAFVGSSDYGLGLATATYLFEAMGGKGSVVIIEGIKGSSTNTERARGFSDAVKAFPEIKVLASQPGNYQRLQALQVMENLLQTHHQIDGVLAANDAMASGVIEALDGAGRQALVIGINGTKEAFDAIRSGKLLATGDYGGFLQGCVGTMAVIRKLRDEPIHEALVFKPVLIDKTNVQSFDVPAAQRSCPNWEQATR